MASAIFIPSNQNNEEIPPKAPPSIEPMKPKEEQKAQPQGLQGDTVTLDHGQHEIKDDVIAPQLATDVKTLEKGLIVMKRTPSADINPQLMQRVTRSYYGILVQLKGHKGLPAEVSANFGSATVHYLDMAEKYRKAANIELDVMMANKANNDDERRINDISVTLAGIYRAEEELYRSSGTFSFSMELTSRIQKNMEFARELAEKLLHIATKKGYVIKNFDGVALAAEEEAEEEIFHLKDLDEERSVSSFKKKCDQILEEVEAVAASIWKQQEIERASSIRKLSEIKHELALMERKYLKKLTERKLKNKIKAEVIVLAYLLKNPASLTVARIEEIRNEINKIKWRTAPRQV